MLRHPSVTDLVKPNLVAYFALPGGILTSLAPAGKNPWSILFLPGVEFSFPGEACSTARKSYKFGIPFLFLQNPERLAPSTLEQSI